MGEKKGDEGKKKGPVITIHLELCAMVDMRIDAVELVKGDSTDNRLPVVRMVDPKMLRGRIETKISPPHKKEKEGGDKTGRKDKDKEKENPRKPAVTTAVLKFKLNCICEGCIGKIKKISGVEQVKIVDEQKNLVTVKGTMNVKAFPDILKAKLNKNVEIVPPKKENGGGDKKGKEGGGGGGVEKKDKKCGGQRKENKEKKEGGRQRRAEGR